MAWISAAGWLWPLDGQEKKTADKEDRSRRQAAAGGVVNRCHKNLQQLRREKKKFDSSIHLFNILITFTLSTNYIATIRSTSCDWYKVNMGNSPSQEEVENVGYRVLGVQANSPASSCGLVSFFDFIVGANRDTTDSYVFCLVWVEGCPFIFYIWTHKSMIFNCLCSLF